MSTKILVGDCRAVMATFEPNSIQAIVCDPPYGISFMGRSWDGTGVAFDPETWEACKRVLVPGGYLLAFGGTRTSHRMVCAIEDAGFEIRDTISWIYGSGFPKSMNVGKAIDKAAGAEREVVGFDEHKHKQQTGQRGTSALNDRIANNGDITAPATDAAKQWDGWGTALKPAMELIVMARKPLSEKTVAANVLAYGTGAINVDACRVESEPRTINNYESTGAQGCITHTGVAGHSGRAYATRTEIAGRWPANVILDEQAAEALDQMSGERSAGAFPGRTQTKPKFNGTTYNNGSIYDGAVDADRRTTDTGGASRYFKVIPQDDDAAPTVGNWTQDSEAGIIPLWERPDQSQNEQTGTTSQQRDTCADESTAKPGLSTSGCGSKPTGQSPTDSKSITSTAINRTTISSTLNYCQGQITSDCIAAANSETESGSNHVQSVEILDPSIQSIGISPREDTPSTDVADHAISPELLPISNGGERFAYCPKAPTSERLSVNGVSHPTQKPIALMRWLVKLITPPGGVVLDPFCGSGSTGIAADREGFNFIGIEENADYAEIARLRIIGDSPMFVEVLTS